MEILKVSAKSNPNSVAGAITSILKRDGVLEIQSIGAGAVNQAIKAVAIAKVFVNTSDQDLFCIPSFIDIELNGEKKTAIKLLVKLSN